jgi:hypothetical protein
MGMLFGLVVLTGYLFDWTWTGFTGNTLWDWLGLFLVPFLLPLVLLLIVDSDSTDRNGRPTERAEMSGRRPASTGPRDKGSQRVSLLLAAVGGVGLTGALMAVAFSVGRTSSESADVYSVKVDSHSQHWTDTGIQVQRGDRVEIAAFGRVRPHLGPNAPEVGPTGIAQYKPAQRSLTHHWNHAALLATVAARSASMPQNEVPKSPMLYVGRYGVLTLSSSGELYLGVNDAGTNNNSGSFAVLIRFESRA